MTAGATTPGARLLLEAASRTCLQSPLRALQERCPRLASALAASAELLSDFPRHPPGIPLLDATLNGVLSVYFGHAFDEDAASNQLLDQVSAVLHMEIRSGGDVWSPTEDAGLALWREGRAPLQQRPRSGVSPSVLPAKELLARRLFSSESPRQREARTA